MTTLLNSIYGFKINTPAFFPTPDVITNAHYGLQIDAYYFTRTYYQDSIKNGKVK